MHRKVRNLVRSVSTFRALCAKWEEDKLALPLTDAHWPIYRSIHKYYERRLGRFPDLQNCPDYNDKIQWLKLFDQNPQIVECVDKVRMRHFVERRLGSGYTPELYAVVTDFDQLDFHRLPRRFVIKSNHDSGSAIIVDDKFRLDPGSIRRKMNRALRRTYGVRGGEWAYQHVKPKILVEERLPGEGNFPPADYKFHCVNGRIKLLAFIYERGSDTKETTVETDGTPIYLRTNDDGLQTMKFTKPKYFEQMKELVERLATGFKYVRVDAYSINGRTVIGELTFYPQAGIFKGEGQKALGQRLEFDRTTFRTLYSVPSEPTYDNEFRFSWTS